MLRMLGIADYLRSLTDEEVKHFVVIKFDEYVKSIREKFGKVAEWFYTFLNNMLR